MNILKSKKILQLLTSFVMLFGLANGVYYIKNNFKNTVSAKQNKNIVTIFDGQKKQTLAVKNSTVEEVLKLAKIKISKSDIIEPNLSYIINSDVYVNIYRASPITIVDGEQKIKIITPYKQAKQILKQANMEYFFEDQSEININNINPTQDIGVELVIKRAKKINLELYNKRVIVRSQSNTVGELLKEKKIKLSKNDHLNYKINDKLNDNMFLSIWFEGQKQETIEEEINYKVRKVYNYDKNPDYKNIKTKGKKGKKIVTYLINTKNKQQISKTELKSVIVENPTEEVIEIGVKGVFNTPSENENIVWEYLITQGFTREQAAGIMGNLMQEHRFSTTDVAGGLGICQWIGGRRTRLINKYQDSYLSINSQLDYMMFELNANGLANKIKQTKNVKDALEIFQNQFERCGICRQDLRMKYAMNILASH